MRPKIVDLCTVIWDIFTGADFCETLVFCIKRKFPYAKVHYLPTHTPTYPFLLMCRNSWVHYTFMSQEVSHKISKNLYLVKISHLKVICLLMSLWVYISKLTRVRITSTICHAKDTTYSNVQNCILIIHVFFSKIKQGF